MKYVKKIFENINNDYEDIKEIILSLIKMSFPTTFFFLCVFLQQSINLSFISKNYKDYKMIDAIGMTHLYINCTSFVFCIGLIAGIESLASNAFSMKQYYTMGLYINRARILSYTVLIVMTIFNYFFAISILSYFTTDKVILEYCNEYIYKNMIMLFIEVSFNINLRVFSIIGKSNINLIILSITILLHPLWCYIFITHYQMGVSGAAYSLILTQFLNTFSSTMYIWIKNPVPGAFFWFNAECFSGLFEYGKIALPTALISISEWLGYEIQSIFAIKVGELEYSVQLILLSLEIITFTYSLGYSISIGIKVADFIVKDNKDFKNGDSVEYCKKYIKYGYIFSQTTMIMIMITIYILRENIIGLYTNIEEVFDMAIEIIPYICIYGILDNARVLLTGSFKGLTYLKVPAYVQLISYYFVQTSLSYILALKNGFGIKGIWLSYIISNLSVDIIFLTIMSRFDFNKYRQISILRLNNDTGNLDLIDSNTMTELNTISYNSRSVSLISDKYF